MAFAEGTTVSVSKTRIEIEDLLEKYKATHRAVAVEPGRAVVYFVMGNRHVRFAMPLATLEQAPKMPKRRWREFTEDQRRGWLEQRHREQWRALLLTLKAKFVALEGKVETFEQAFLAHLVVPGGGTVGEEILPRLEEAYRTGQMPRSGFLLGPGGTS
jgi:hypothetical protein